MGTSAKLKARHWPGAGCALLLTAGLSACAVSQRPVVTTDGGLAPVRTCASGTVYARTELFFGKSIADGGSVTDPAFAEFLDREVTPRFPDGFTVVPSMGQYREANGVIDREASDIVIFLYPRTSASDASRKIDEIRAAYTKSFHQESVLRDDEQPACVAFR